MRVEPADIAALSDFDEIESYYKGKLGFLPNSARLLAHRPSILRASIDLGRATQSPDGAVDMKLKKMVALVASSIRGCTFCQTHAAYGLSSQNVPDGNIAAVWDFETDDRFDDRERAALRLARDSAVQPNSVTDAHFEELRRYFSDEQIIELVAQCAFSAWLNVFNQTLGTTIESEPAEWTARTGIIEIDPVHLA